MPTARLWHAPRKVLWQLSTTCIHPAQLMGGVVPKHRRCCLCRSSARLAGADAANDLLVRTVDQPKSAAPAQHQCRIALPISDLLRRGREATRHVGVLTVCLGLN